MEHRDIVQHVLTEFGKVIELDTLTLNESGSCRLMFDEDVEVNFELDDATGSLLLISPVVEARDDLFADVLELNLFWGQLNGCRFTLLRSANVLALLRRVPIDGLTLISFEQALEQLLETVAVWRKALATTPADDTRQTAPACGWNIHNLTGRA